MTIGRRDARALKQTEGLVAAAAEMRKKGLHLQTVKEYDHAELERMMSDMRRLRDEIAAQLAVIHKTFVDIAVAVERVEKERARQ